MHAFRVFFTFCSLLWAISGYGSELVYIVDGDGFVTVVDTADLTTAIHAPYQTYAPPSPMGMDQITITISPDGSRLFVPGAVGSPTVSVFDIDPNTGLLINHTSFGGFVGAFELAFSPDGAFFYISDFGSNTLNVYDANLNLLNTIPIMTVLPTPLAQPTSIAISPNGSRLYVACVGSSEIRSFDIVSVFPYLINEVIVSSGGMNPYVVEIDRTGTYVYATNLSDSVITRFDADLSNAMSVGPGTTLLNMPVGIAFDPDGSRIYVANSGNDTISVLDLNPLSLFTPIIPALSSQGVTPRLVSINLEGTQLFVTNSTDNTLSVRYLTHNTYPPVTGSPFSPSLTRPHGVAFRTISSLSPMNLTGKQKTNNFGIQFELFNLLQWQPPASGGVIGYCIYRDGVKIATVSGSTLQYEDHNRKKGVETVYSVTSLDEDSLETTPVTVVVR